MIKEYLKKINWFQLLVYISLIFLALYFFNKDDIGFPKIKNWYYFFLSLFFLLGGFVFNVGIWHKLLLIETKADIKLKSSFSSIGLSIFAKYIPGKVFIILGRALYIAKKYRLSKSSLSVISLNTQVVMIFSGLILSLPIFLFIVGNQILIFSYVAVLLVLGLWLFNYRVNRLVNLIIYRLIGKKVNFTSLSYNKLFKISPFLVGSWLSWAFGFYLLVLSILDQPFNLIASLVFILSATYGIVAIFAPGGLGVREAIMVFCLSTFSIGKVAAIEIAAASRIWFLIGEVLIFFIGLILEKFANKPGITLKKDASIHLLYENNSK